MHHLPNDTIAVTLPDFGQSMTVLGDPGLATGDWGGNDALTAAISISNSNVTLVGEDLAAMHGNSHGGNDSLGVSVDGGWDSAVAVGDAQSMADNSQGGNDTLNVDAQTRSTPMFISMAMSKATCRATREAEMTRRGNAHGGNIHGWCRLRTMG